MKNLQKGFIAPVLIGIIALLIIGGGVYVYETKKAETPSSTDVQVQQSDQVQPTNSQNPSQNTQPKISDTTKVVVMTNTEIISKLVVGWKNIAFALLPGFPNPTVAFYGYPYTIQFISNSRIIIAYQDDFNPLFAILNYDSSRQQFSYLDGLRSSPFEVSESLWNTWRKKYGDISYPPQTYGFSSTRTGDTVYPSDWKKVTKNPFVSVKPDIIVLSPNGGENWKIGQTYSISVATKGDLGTKTVRLNRYSDDGVRVGEQTIGTMQANTFSFKVPVGTDETRGAAGRYKIQVVSDKYNSGMGVSDESDNYFSISSPTQQAEKIQVYVNVVDKDGKPFRPDKVEWYYPPVNGQAIQYPAKCTNEACTRWSVTGATASKIYVVANYRKPSPPGALCFSQAYDAKLVELSSASAEITLTMGLESYCE